MIKEIPKRISIVIACQLSERSDNEAALRRIKSIGRMKQKGGDLFVKDIE